MRPADAMAMVVLALGPLGCSDGTAETTGGEASAGTGGTSQGGGGGAQGGGGAAPATLSVSLPQVVGGAAQVNPNVYATIPFRVVASGPPIGAVRAELAGDSVAASYEEGSKSYVAMLPVEDLPDGEVDLLVSVDTAEQPDAFKKTVTLRVARDGVQLTDFFQDHHAVTPRIYAHGDGYLVTHTDTSSGTREGWLRALDGAGRWQGERIPITPGEEGWYMRTALGEDRLAVLFQDGGGAPYMNHLRLVDLDGKELLPTMDLDPEGCWGSYYGDVAFDGSAFVALWRFRCEDGKSEIRWLRIDAQSLAVTGPVTVASAGDGKPDGVFPDLCQMSVAGNEQVSLVSFSREYHNPDLEPLPRAQLARLDAGGKLLSSEYLALDHGLREEYESRVFRFAGGFLPLWGSYDLTLPEPNSMPVYFHATTTGAAVAADCALRIEAAAATTTIGGCQLAVSDAVVAAKAGGTVVELKKDGEATIAGSRILLG
ncbi:MAG: hypothetical protein HY744_17060 [Deltaproteobacteria bacterium]|nr:hypothetical protein [Deltaproteobacteria bacterium]